jgi:hypothetical protein
MTSSATLSLEEDVIPSTLTSYQEIPLPIIVASSTQEKKKRKKKEKVVRTNCC